MYKAKNFSVFFISIMSYLKAESYTDLQTYIFIFLDNDNTFWSIPLHTFLYIWHLFNYPN